MKNKTVDQAWMTRATLLSRARDPEDHASWEEFVAYYSGYIYQVARRMGLDHHDAQEVLQNTTLKAWKHLPQFEYDRRKGRFRGWLCRVAGNEVKQLHRRRERTLAGLSEDEREDLRFYLAHLNPNVSSTAAEEEWRAYITKAAWDNIEGDFEAKTRQAFELTSQGESDADVASQLGVAESTVRVYRKRVHDRLIEEITKLNDVLD